MNPVVETRHALRSMRVSEEPEVKTGPKGWRVLRKVLLVCGILSSLLYVGADVLAAMRYEGYSYASQTVSELSAIGAPSRPLIVPLYLTDSVLVIAFALGVWGSDGRKRALRVVAGLLVGYGAFGFVGPFTPMHQRALLAAGGGTLTDSLHIISAMVDVLFILLIIGFGANAFGKRFRLYSIGTLLVLVVCGALTGLDGPRVGANLPTPWVGVTERINIFGYMLWVVVLAITLLRLQGSTATDMSWPRRDGTFIVRDLRQGAYEEVAEAKHLARPEVPLRP